MFVFWEKNSHKLASSFTGWADGFTLATADPLTHQILGSSEVLRDGIPWDAGDDSNELEPATGVELQSCNN